jgi:hypothetical protein
MMDYCTLGRAKSGFALAAAITILFNTALACAKDADPPLSRFMGSVAGHNWTTQGLVDLILFLGLGLTFTKAGWAGRIKPRRLISLLVAAVVIGSVGLFAWYALF